ncbi:hypothetical protein AB0M20_31620 [Actinoplanes sp. NPDC051633]|uniref:hypothetical protein n=1 Tax=Actinoplanes sp. NPDC051633 TaxID=3155670 RepID=UPI0034127540
MNAAVDLRTILFEDPGKTAATITGELVGCKPGEEIGGALRRMPDAAKKAVLDRVGTAASELLDQDLTDIMGSAWSKHSALRAAALATLTDPSTVREPELGAHTMSFRHAPAVELRIGEHAVATVTLQIQLELQIKTLKVTVRRGRLTAIRTGSCDIVGTLKVMDSRVAHRTVTLDLPGTLSLGRGIDLLAGEEP